MPVATISLADLLHQLESQRHELFVDDKGDSNVCPPVDVVVHIGLGADPMLEVAYRQNYFACYWTEEGRVKAELEPTLSFQGVWRELELQAAVSRGGDSVASTESDGRHSQNEEDKNAFLNGPMRWLIARIQRFDQILLWPAGAFRRQMNSASIDRQSDSAIDEAEMFQLIKTAGLNNESDGALVLDLQQAADCRLIWRVAQFVSHGFDNFYVADSALSEVYVLHHHSRILVSIPSAERRQQLLDELNNLPDVFVDCSGYTSPYDEEDEEDNA